MKAKTNQRKKKKKTMLIEILDKNLNKAIRIKK